MSKQLIEDIIEWDVKNWSRSLRFWANFIELKDGGKNCLELGGRRGGLSLWLAINGHKVICSDVESPELEASKKHVKYSCIQNVRYESINATDIPYENKFDIVVFKSILGGISGNGRDELKQKAIFEIHKSLKPNGKLLFAENLESSVIHKMLRRNFISWGDRWNYLKFQEIDSLFSIFGNVQYETTGFFGAFGRSERQRRLLSHFDSVIKPIIPKSKRYVVFGVAVK